MLLTVRKWKGCPAREPRSALELYEAVARRAEDAADADTHALLILARSKLVGTSLQWAREALEHAKCQRRGLRRRATRQK